MNKNEAAAALAAAQDAYEASCDAHKKAFFARKRSRSKQNVAALAEAKAVFDAALDAMDLAWKAFDAAEIAAKKIARAEAKASAAFIEPDLFAAMGA